MNSKTQTFQSLQNVKPNMFQVVQGNNVINEDVSGYAILI